MHYLRWFYVIFAVVVMESDSCCLDEPEVPCYAPAPLAATYVTKSPCFNPKAALYQKFPLLYKIHEKGCKLFCKKVNGVNPCPPTRVAPLCAAPAPVCAQPAPVYAPPAPVCAPSAPVYAPPPSPVYAAPVPINVPVCAAPSPSQAVFSPEVLNTLLAFSGAESCQAPPLEPALSYASA